LSSHLRAVKKHQVPTMKDVADLVGVSKQTVSAVINNKPGITEETRARVLAAIKQLGYRMDYTARSLRTGQTRTIALLITDVSSPFAGKIASVAEDAAYASHYNLVLYNTRDDVEREQNYIYSAVQRSVDGVLFVSARDESTVPESLEAFGIPVVILDRVPKGYQGPSITIDNLKAGQVAAEHLLTLGHCSFAHIAGPASLHISKGRLEGFSHAVQMGHPGRDITIERAENWKVESGYLATQRLLARKVNFTALFVAGDMLAIGAIRALRDAGLDIPADVSVVSVDDIDIVRYHHPPLTTVSQFVERMATLGVEMLLDLLSGNNPPQPQIVIDPKLIVRESTAPPRQG
jgi:DNA-binding LacI/PurR family transcriptional regulator